jgi:hypothetical protein
MRKHRRPHLQVESLESRIVPSTQSFDTITPPGLPASWMQWSSDGSTVFATAAGQGVGGSTGLAAAGTSRTSGLAWISQAEPGDTAVSANVNLNSLVPTLVFTRGANLGTSTPSYLAAAVTRGATVTLLEVTNGAAKVLASLSSPSSSYFSGGWVQVSLVPSGSAVAVQLMRLDSGQYLNAQGAWQAGVANVLSASTSLPDASGDVGVGRVAAYSGTVTLDNFTFTPPPPVAPPPPPAPVINQSFDTTAVGSSPAGWQTWASDSTGTAAAASSPALSSPNSYELNGGSATQVRAWSTASLPGNVSGSVALDLNTLVPAELIIDGSNLDSSSPSYDAVVLSRGLQASVIQVTNGTAATLGTLKSASYFSAEWVRVGLRSVGNELLASIYRTDTQQWLTAAGNWSATPAFAFQVQAPATLSGGETGVGRLASYAGPVAFDDFSAGVPGSVGPGVAVTSSAGNGPVTGSVTFQATATGNPGQIAFLLNGQVQSVSTSSPASWTLNTASLASGSYTLTVLAGCSTGMIAVATQSFSVQDVGTSPPPPVSPPTSPPFSIPLLDPSTGIAELAYAGTPIGTTETQLLQQNVDLVVSNPALMPLIAGIAPKTPQLIYNNVSNIYQGLLLSWLNYAKANGIDPESAFYHVTRPTPFTGSSASSQPVNWFWGVFQSGQSGAAPIDLTSASHTTTGNGFSLGSAGQWTAFGYPRPFAEIDVSLKQASLTGWNAVWQYPTAVDANGNPTAWGTLALKPTVSNSPLSTTITFDPPANWVPSTAQPGGERLYYVRLLVTSGGASQAPIARTIQGANYTGFNGTSGTIPVFDYSADADHDGYLDDAEWANRAPGDNARFAYQSELFYPYYGQMRYVTNPSSTAYQAWAASYNQQLLKQYPLASGVFLDNESGKVPFSGISVRESTASYTADSATLVAAVAKSIGSNKLVMVNASGGTPQTEAAVAAAAGSVFEESLLRPLASTWSTVGDVTNLVDSLLAASGSPYVVLDSMPTGGSPTDPRTELATLAYYDLFSNPGQTMLMFYGGYSPNTSWSQHWTQAAAANIGKPTGSMEVVASGSDPENTALTYKVFGRTFSNGLVLYKPLSYAEGVGTGTLDNATATTVQLGGNYRQVNADGSQGPVITSISLRNGEGAVLVKA